MPFLEQYPHIKILQSLARRKNLKVYLVGGFLRDFLLNRQRPDFDFAVNKNAVNFARAFAKDIKGAFVLLDKEHGCARVVKKNNGILWTFDFADFRDKNKTLKGDLSHRDFTINTLCVDLNKLKNGDSLNKVLIEEKKGFKGLKDLKAKTIRMTNKNVFKEDPLRLLRAYSQQATLAFKIESKTLARIQQDKDLIKNVAFERVRDELFKILASDRAAMTLKAMDRIGLLEKVIPQIRVMVDCTQGGYHHLDVWPHSLETVRQLEEVFSEFSSDEQIREYLKESLAGDHRRFALMKLAALLHDIGKPDTKKVEVDRTSFHGHERVGKDIVRSVAKWLKLSTRERHILEDIVLWHLRPGYLSNFKSPSERSIFRYFRDTKDEAVSVALLSLADQRSTRGPLTSEADQKHHEKIVKDLLKRYFEEKRKVPLKRLIDGNDLIRELKLKPGPIFAKILREVEEKQAMGEISSKEEALELAGTIAL